MRVFILDPGNTQVRIKLHDKPLHLFVVLSRMALVDTILPYLFQADKNRERQWEKLLNTGTAQRVSQCVKWHNSTGIHDPKDMKHKIYHNPWAGKKEHHPKELLKSAWNTYNSETKSHLWQNHPRTLDADSPGALDRRGLSCFNGVSMRNLLLERTNHHGSKETLVSAHACVCVRKGTRQ